MIGSNQVQYAARRGFYLVAQAPGTTPKGKTEPAGHLPNIFLELEQKGQYNVSCTTHELKALNTRLHDACNDCLTLTAQVRSDGTHDKRECNSHMMADHACSYSFQCRAVMCMIHMFRQNIHVDGMYSYSQAGAKYCTHVLRQTAIGHWSPCRCCKMPQPA